MAHLIDKNAVLAKIEKRVKVNKECMLGLRNLDYYQGKVDALNDTISFIDTLEVKEANVSDISENLAEAYEYLDFTSTGNLAHNKPMVSARLKKAIKSLFDAGLFELIPVGNYCGAGNLNKKKMIEDFRNYMKGE